MEDSHKIRDPQSAKIAMDLHLAKFNYFMAKKNWKSAVTELQHALNAVIEILDHANRTLKKIAERYRQNQDISKVEGGVGIEGAIKTEKISEDTLLIEYPGDKIVLKKV